MNRAFLFEEEKYFHSCHISAVLPLSDGMAPAANFPNVADGTFTLRIAIPLQAQA